MGAVIGYLIYESVEGEWSWCAKRDGESTKAEIEGKIETMRTVLTTQHGLYCKVGK